MKLFFYSVLVCFLGSCKRENTKLNNNKINFNNEINVNLNKQSNYGPFKTILQPFSLPKQLPNFTGIPNADSISIQVFRTTKRAELEKLFNQGKIDSLELQHLDFNIYALSAIQNNKQIIILDKNQNLDFSDDGVQKYDKNVRLKIRRDHKLRDTLPVVNIKYKKYFRDKLRDRDLYIRLMPYQDYFIFDNPTKETNLYSKMQIVGAIIEHWTGTFVVDSLEYKTAVSNHWNDFQIVFREQDKPFYSRRNKDDEYEEFVVGDTVQLGSHFIKIDSVGADLKILYLQKLQITSLPHGYKKGQELRDYSFTNIEGVKQNMSKLLEKKDYLLIDFWGTWCIPCIQLTPDLKKFHENYPNVAMLGVDFDYEKEPGVKYIKNKELDWTHTFIERVRKDSLLHTKLVGKLRIDNYPTFMLIDKDLKILYRGIGKKGLDRIEELVVAYEANEEFQKKKEATN